jgi:dynein heavy chain 1
MVTMIMSYLRPDRFVASSQGLIKAAFESPLRTTDPTTALREYVTGPNAASSPIILCSVPGYDASFRVEALASGMKAECASIAMGSSEGTRLADQAISQAARTGKWVLLKNVHLAHEWLSSLEKRMRTIQADSRFRLFLTMETSPKIPVSILLQSRIIMNEPAPGVRASLLDSLHSFDALEDNAAPAERARLYFLLAWFHAVLQERSRYNPLGWSSAYDFNNADLYAAAGTMTRWIAGVAKGRSNVDPAEIPWRALRSLLTTSIYGGRVDSVFDQRVLASFSRALFHARAYDSDFCLVEDTDPTLALRMPDALTLEQFREWASDLPQENPHSWLGLPVESEKVLLESKGTLRPFCGRSN